VTATIFGLIAAIVLVALAGAIASAVVSPRLVRQTIAISTLASIALTAALAVTWTQLPHYD
jgi:hypothetical protein